ncbi:hypothetical protein [Nitrobacter sp. TKz-YC02]|uniref:hypothetical protein n=1 Tax=Nitrobacter sp. TKz-YC02 TaxID=3398704 RepID=UPI003CE97524
MAWQKRLATVHRLLSLAVALAVPLAAYLVNGTLEPWMFVVGAVIGFSYCFPFFLP